MNDNILETQDMIDSASRIHNLLEELEQLRYGEKKIADVGIEKGMHLLRYIREQEGCLETWYKQYVKATRFLLWFLWAEQRHTDAMMIALDTLAEIEARENPVEDVHLAMMIYQTSVPLMSLRRFDEALAYLHRAYLMIEAREDEWLEVNDADEINEVKGAVINMLGHVYSNGIHKPEVAVEWYKKALQLDIESGNDLYIAGSLYSLVAGYNRCGEYDEAIKYGEQGIAHINLKFPDKEKVYVIYMTLGFIYNDVGRAWLAKGDVAQADQYFRRGLAIHDDNDHALGRLYSLRGLGNVAIEQQNYAVAIDYLTRALVIAEQTIGEDIDNAIECCECHERLAEAYRLDGNFEMAFKQYEQYHQMYEEVHDEKKRQSLKQLEVKHRTEIAQVEAAKMRVENEALEQLVAARVVELKQSLEREAQLSLQLQNALRVTEQINTIRAEMINTIAHELRTPLTIINMSTNLLKNHYDRFPEEKRAQHFTNIEQSIHNLQGMLDDAIQIDQFKVGDIGTVDNLIPFAELCTQIQTALTGDHASRLRFSFDGDAEQSIKIDTALLLQGIAPLLDNALTYSDDEVEVNVALNVDNKLDVIIRDEGIGITADEMPHIFELFYRSSRTQFLRGLGLGLYTARHVVQLLGGAITAESAGASSGSNFVVTVQ